MKTQVLYPSTGEKSNWHICVLQVIIKTFKGDTELQPSQQLSNSI
jgi:hypothetical protein